MQQGGGTEKIWPIGGKLVEKGKFKSVEVIVGEPVIPGKKLSKEKFTAKILGMLKKLGDGK
jgi:hypothetical protein